MGIVFLLIIIIALTIHTFTNNTFFLSPIIIILLIIEARLCIKKIEKESNKIKNKEFHRQREFQQKQSSAQLNQHYDDKIYEKKRLMTFTERQFHEAIKKAVPENYILLPQVNLATIIRRVDEHIYQNELYRNIDFAIFNSDYMPLLLIEINDDTHNEIDRRERDRKVKEICQCAQLPIITFWTEYGINEEYIYKTIHKYI